VLLVDDPDAPMPGSFVHWVVSDLDPDEPRPLDILIMTLTNLVHSMS
jgi:phosphatidylethanolamine-binding protein (PEBP) family uncharacterized protein